MLHVVTCLFNPCRYQRIWNNYDRFREQLKAPLTTVELSFDGTFHVPDAIQLQGDPLKHTLWQKERLLNLAIQAVPESFDAVAWIDADVLFTDPDWLEQTEQALERFPIVQLFDNVELLDASRQLFERRPGVVAKYLETRNSSVQLAHPGFAWAARRNALTAGLFDQDVVGGGDTTMLHGWLKTPSPFLDELRSAGWRRAIAHWEDHAYPAVNGELGALCGTIQHLWHGDRKNRHYVDRMRWLTEHDYDPATDLRLDDQGLWTWSSHKPAMHSAIRRYFQIRQDDGPVPPHDAIRVSISKDIENPAHPPVCTPSASSGAAGEAKSNEIPDRWSYRWQRERVNGIRSQLRDNRLSIDKLFAKNVVAHQGYRVPRSLAGDDLSFVLKPNSESCAKNVVVVQNGQIRLGQQYGNVLEELVVDENGQVPPRDFKCYCFGYEVKLIQVINRLTKTFAYYDPLHWEALHDVCGRPWEDHARPERLPELLAMARQLSRLFDFPVRVDAYITSESVVFGEFCLASGLAQNLQPAADALLGRWWREHFDALGIADEFSRDDFPQAYLPRIQAH
ncbi:ATP-grasp fold amidoligase family protein [Planctopirus hydrillae]|uniref:Uncharacterized protein n=1 Tax=Planctopirus hydrillae TaxID=1841610 RepID=A0A1C3EDZ1_9PLAN|nr:ATP-grasp fold amidoligase family protein [Planctopirus hydrillae]ODA31439.1 hypothetical protein A6X21_22410 [Planctopirus hydrillae]